MAAALLLPEGRQEILSPLTMPPSTRIQGESATWHVTDLPTEAEATSPPSTRSAPLIGGSPSPDEGKELSRKPGNRQPGRARRGGGGAEGGSLGGCNWSREPEIFQRSQTEHCVSRSTTGHLSSSQRGTRGVAGDWGQSHSQQLRSIQRRWSVDHEGGALATEASQNQHFRQGKGPWYSTPVEAERAQAGRTTRACPVLWEEDIPPMRRPDAPHCSLEDQILQRQQALRAGGSAQGMGQGRRPMRQERSLSMLVGSEDWLTSCQPGSSGQARRLSHTTSYRLLNDLRPSEGSIPVAADRVSPVGVSVDTGSISTHVSFRRRSTAGSSPGPDPSTHCILHQEQGHTSSMPAGRSAANQPVQHAVKIPPAPVAYQLQSVPRSLTAPLAGLGARQGATERPRVKGGSGRITRVRFAEVDDVHTDVPEFGLQSCTGQRTEGGDGWQYSGCTIQRVTSAPVPTQHRSVAASTPRFGYRNTSVPLLSAAKNRGHEAFAEAVGQAGSSRLPAAGMSKGRATEMEGELKKHRDQKGQGPSLEDTWGAAIGETRDTLSSETSTRTEVGRPCTLLIRGGEKGGVRREASWKQRTGTLEEIWAPQQMPHVSASASQVVRIPSRDLTVEIPPSSPLLQRTGTWGCLPVSLSLKPALALEQELRTDRNGTETASAPMRLSSARGSGVKKGGRRWGV